MASSRTRTAVLAGVLALVALTAPAAGRPASHSVRDDVASVTVAHEVAHERAPGHHRAAVCGSRGLDGPARPPRGAIVVRNRNLGVVASHHRPGATFWVSPGIHHLGSGPYDQVDPKDRQVFIGAPGAVIDGQHRNLYAFGGTASHVVVSHLTIQNFGSKGDNNNQGVVNHDAAPGWRIRHNTVQHVAGAAVFMGNRNHVVGNCLTRNGQYGFSSYRPHGVHHLVLRHNEISYNNTDDWEALQPNCGCSGGGKFWDSDHVRVLDNWVHHNYGPGLWADTNNTGFLIEGNRITDNQDEGLFYEISYNARIVHNTFARNSWVKGRHNNDFTGAIYLSESGSDTRAGSTYGRRFVLGHNRFVDNWAGIIAWENPDRFSGSPANSSTGYTTLVNPKVATVQACSTPSKIATKPYFDDCRWKVRHLRVQHNRFVFHPSRIPGCTTSAGCGFQGLVSNYGTYPSWSPYQAYVVPNNITFHQNNRWLDNTYVGPWHFEIHTLGHTVSWKKWRSSKYGQDTGSTRE